MSEAASAGSAESRPARSLLSQALLVTGLSILNLAGNLGNGLVVAYFYGATMERDAYLVAQIIPAYLVSVFSGILALLFLPVFVEEAEKDKRSAWQFAYSLGNVSAVALAALSLGLVLTAATLTRALAPEFEPAQLELAARLLRILAPSIIFQSLASLCSSLLYSQGRFALGTVAPLAGTLVAIALNVILHPSLGIDGLAIASAVGSVCSFALLLPQVLRLQSYQWIIHLENAALANLARTCWPLVLASLVYRFNSGYERIIAARLPSGSVSYVGYASQIVSVLTILTSTGIVTTVYSALSTAYAKQDMAEVRRNVEVGIRAVLLVGLPIFASVMVFGRAMVMVFYERGAFTSSATDSVTLCLWALLPGFLMGNLGAVVARIFYVAQRTRFLALWTVCETVLYVGTALLLAHFFSFVGLAAALSIRDTVSLPLYLVIASRMLGGLHRREFLFDCGRIALAALAFAIVLLGVRLLPFAWLFDVPRMCGGIFLGGMLYAFLTVGRWGVPEAKAMWGAVQLRLQSIRLGWRATQ